MISRRSLFCFLAGAPVGAVAAALPSNEPAFVLDPFAKSYKLAGTTLYPGSLVLFDDDYQERIGEVRGPIPIDRRLEEIEAKYMADGFESYWKSRK